MRKIYGLGLIFLLSWSAGCSSSAPTAEAEAPFRFTPTEAPTFRTEGLRVATLNAEFLFDGEGREGEATFPHKGDPAAARAHRDRIGTVIRMLDADLLLLTEIENEHVLDLLREESLADLGYAAHFIEGRDTFTGQDVGLLARVPVDTVGRTDVRVNVGTTQRTYGVSKNLFARLRLGDQAVTLIGVHFLSQASNPERRDRREAQAEVIRQLSAQETALGRALIVLGDFNDYDDRTPDFSGSEPVTDVLSILKSAGPSPEDNLLNLIAEVPQHQRFTAHWDRNRNEDVEADELTAIDHILISNSLYAHLLEVTYVHAHDPLTTTDHFPIVATFDF